jgi:hypothetical protein
MIVSSPAPQPLSPLPPGRVYVNNGKGNDGEVSMRFWLSLLCITLGMNVVAAPPSLPTATPPSTSPPTSGNNSGSDPLAEQAIIAARYRQLEEMLLRIAQKMERSGNAESVKKARVIQKALKEARDKGIAVNLLQLAESLKSPNLATLKKAVEQGTVIKADLEALLLSLLLEDENKGEQIKLITQLLKELDQAIRDQKLANTQNQSSSVPKAEAAKAQHIAENRAKSILDKIKAEEKRQGKSDDKEKKDSKAPQDSKQPGDPKESKPSDPKSPKPSESDPQNQPQQPKEDDNGGSGLPKKQMQEANQAQQQARKRIDENRRQEASQDQQEATKKLEEARKRLEEILRQLREEEQIRVLADLQRRCEKMLQMQEIVYEGTKRLEAKIKRLPDGRPSRDEEIEGLQLSSSEEKIGFEADQALAVIDAEGSSVAFSEVFRQVRTDIGHVARRLARTNPGPETQLIEEDIIATLKEMIEALKKQQKEMRDRKENQQQQNQQPPDPSLLDLLAELRMIKALQVRVLQRTEKWSKLYKGEQATDPEIVPELRDLAQRQLKIYQITDNLAKGRNR